VAAGWWCAGWLFPLAPISIWLSTGYSVLLARRFLPSECYSPPASLCSCPTPQPDYLVCVEFGRGTPVVRCFHRLVHGSCRAGWILRHLVPAPSTPTATSALFPAGDFDCSWLPAARGIILPSPRSVSAGFPSVIRWLPPALTPLLLSGRKACLVVPRSPAAAGSRRPAIRRLRQAEW
jgi:hypothetical protein